MKNYPLFSLKGKNIIVTGGAGLLGRKHVEAIIDFKGFPIIIDNNSKNIENFYNLLDDKYPKKAYCLLKADITNYDNLIEVKDRIIKDYKEIHGLINNASNNPKMEEGEINFSRLENFSDEAWKNDIEVGLKGAYYCSRVFGQEMVEINHGSIVNISSDLGIIAPDQRPYKKEGLREMAQPVKPVTYSIVKHGLIGLTKYLATYWAQHNIRANTLCPGGISNNQPEDFVKKLTNLIPLNRMAEKDEYQGALVFLLSEASSYMTGATLVVDGGRTCW